MTKVDVTFEEDTVWLTQQNMANLFQKAKSTINEHIRNIYEEGELKQELTIIYHRADAEKEFMGLTI